MRLEGKRAQVAVRLFLIPTLILMPLLVVEGQTPALDGQWSEPFGLPLIAIHAALLPTGKAFLFGSEHGVPGIHAWVLDPGIGARPC